MATDIVNANVKCPHCGNADLDRLSATRMRHLTFNLNRYPEDDKDPDTIWLDEDRCSDGDETDLVVGCLECQHEGSLEAFGIEEWEMS